MAFRKGLMIPVTLCTLMLGIGGALGQGSEQERAACRQDVKRLCQAELQRNPDDTLSISSCLQLSSNHSVRLPDGATLVASPFQAFIGNFRPELFQLRRCRFVGVPFCIIRSPGQSWGSLLTSCSGRKRVLSVLGSDPQPRLPPRQKLRVRPRSVRFDLALHRGAA